MMEKRTLRKGLELRKGRNPGKTRAQEGLRNAPGDKKRKRNSGLKEVKIFCFTNSQSGGILQMTF